MHQWFTNWLLSGKKKYNAKSETFGVSGERSERYEQIALLSVRLSNLSAAVCIVRTFYRK